MAYPDWLLGRGLTTISVTPQTKTAGNFVAGTVKSFFTVVDQIEWDTGVETEDIRPLTQFHKNMVPVSRGAGFRLTEILRATAAPAGESGNALADMFHGFEWFQVVFTRASRTWTAYYSNGGYTENPTMTKSTGTATFMPIAEEAAPGNDFDTGGNLVSSGAGL